MKEKSKFFNVLDKGFKRLIYLFGIVCIAAWLFTIHSSFAYSLSPLTKNNFFDNLFVMENGFDLKIYIPYLWGAAFSIAITAIITLLKRSDKYFFTFAFTVAALELIGVTLFNYPVHNGLWQALAGIFYGAYAFFLTLFYFYIKPDNEFSQENSQEKSEEKNIFSDNSHEKKTKEENYPAGHDKENNSHENSLINLGEKKYYPEKTIDKELIKSMLQEGEKPKNISEKLGVSLSTVYRIKNEKLTS